MIFQCKRLLGSSRVVLVALTFAFSSGVALDVLASEPAVPHSAEGQPAPHAAGHDAHGSPAHGASGHGASGHGDHHVPQWSEINWYHGVLGEKEGHEPSLLWRAPGTPVPLLTLLLNTAVLFFLLGRIARPALKTGLKSRKERIAGDIEFASKMKADAEEELAKYESKLEKMEAEMQRIRTEMREQAETERETILADAKTRRAALEKDAQDRIAQELAEAKKEATRLAISQAISVAQSEIAKNITHQDQDKLAQDLLGGLDAHFKKGSVVS